MSFWWDVGNSGHDDGDGDLEWDQFFQVSYSLSTEEGRSSVAFSSAAIFLGSIWSWERERSFSLFQPLGEMSLVLLLCLGLVLGRFSS